MRYLIEIKAQEKEDFSLTVQIDAEATFLDLHNLIIENCEFDGTQMTSFFTLDAKGQRLQEISLMELSSEGSEMNVAVMDVATLGEFIVEEVKTLEFEYDFFGDRYFTLEIVEIQEGEQEKAALVTKTGTPPEQLSLDGFEGLDFSEKIGQSGEVDYEKYLSEFDDCKDDGVDFQSLDEWEDDEF